MEEYSSGNKILKQQNLHVHEYLGEFKTEAEKAMARKNIGAATELKSGVNIKTINNESLLGKGNIDITLVNNASDVEYTNSSNTSITNVQDALNLLIDLHYYKQPTFIYTFTVSPSAIYYGTIQDVTWSYKITQTYENTTIKFNGIETKQLEQSLTIKDVSIPKNINLSISSTYSDSKGNSPQQINVTKGPTFQYKSFYIVSDSETLSGTLSELVSGQTINCGTTDKYIYCITRSSVITIKDPSFDFDDTSSFEVVDSNYTLSSNTFNGQVNSVSGYIVTRSINKLNGNWIIKYGD